MSTFGDLFASLAQRPLDRGSLATLSLGWPDRILGLSTGLRHATDDAQAFAALRTALLQLWVIQTPIRLSTFVLDDAPGYDASRATRCDKTVLHVDTRSNPPDLHICELRGNTESRATVNTEGFYQRLRSGIIVSDYEKTGFERHYSEACGAIWCATPPALPAMIEAICGSSKAPIDLFLYESDRGAPAPDPAMAAELTRWPATPIGTIAAFGTTLHWSRVAFVENLRRCSFFDYAAERQASNQDQRGDATRWLIDDAQERSFVKSGPDGVWVRDDVTITHAGFAPQLFRSLMPMVVQKFNDVRVFGPSCNIATPDGRLLCLARPEDYQLTTALGNSEPEAQLDGDLEFAGRHGHFFSSSYAMVTRRIAEPAVLLGLRWNDTFGHVVYDMVPRLMCRDVLPGIDPRYYVIGGPAAGWYVDLLRCCGVEPWQILQIGRFAVAFDEIYVAGKAGSIETGFGDRVLRFYETVMDRVRQAGIAHSPYGFPKRVFISRRNRNNDRRTLINPGPFRELLQKYDIAEIFMEDLSIAQKISLLGQAELALGVFGSGMVNLVFAGRAITTVTIMPEALDHNVDPFNFTRSSHNVHLFYAECILSEEKTPRTDIFVDCVRFEQMLQAII